MYIVEIDGTFSAQFSSSSEAMEHVETMAKPFGKSWVIKDPHGNVFARS